jgi:two-component system chemotaxis response regulator CheB
LTEIIQSDKRFQVVDTAIDPYDAREKLVKHKPDLMTLDIEMPRMDGVTFLKKVMHYFPVRTVVISSLTQEGSEVALKMLEIGAIDVIAKPTSELISKMSEKRAEFIERLWTAAKARLRLEKAVSQAATAAQKNYQAAWMNAQTDKIVAIASSTGGTEALKVFLRGFRTGSCPGMVIVQHLPPGFTSVYATGLKKLFPSFEIREALSGDSIGPNRILIAPANYHMEVYRTGTSYFVRLHQEEPLQGLRPAADYLFRSMSKWVGKNAVGIVLTGMGKDGAKGLLEMKNAGAYTLAQNEETCTVYGMPKEAVRLGAVNQVVALENMASHLLNYLYSKEGGLKKVG